MLQSIYHIKIKKRYVSQILENLQQDDAIEIMEEVIPEWQKKESLKRLDEMKQNGSTTIAEKDFFKMMNQDDEDV